MAAILDSLSIDGFKSIRQLRNLRLGHSNVLIGPNGAGKSNFISFFRFLRDMLDGRLQAAVQLGGGSDHFLHLGPKLTNAILVKARFSENGYDFKIIPTVDGRFVFESETAFYSGSYGPYNRSFGSGHTEALLPRYKDEKGYNSDHGIPHYVYKSVSDWIVYHFNDTSESSSVRRQGIISDNESLRADASNLAAFLYRIKQTHREHYNRIVDIVRLAAPFFGDFHLRPNPTNPEYIQLEWTQQDSEYLFIPSQLSDGTLRFICLATALLQPDLPATLLFDEPELGLHPFALSLLGRLLYGATLNNWGNPRNQIIVSTQSALLLNEFKPHDVIVVERVGGQSVFTRLKDEDLETWLEEYSMGELWQKNVLGGRPRSEQGHMVEAAVDG